MGMWHPADENNDKSKHMLRGSSEHHMHSDIKEEIGLKKKPLGNHYNNLNKER